MTPAISATRLTRLLGPDALARPAYRSLAGAIMALLADGRIASGTRLPSERELTAALGCSRTTVTGAYAVLADRGYLTSRRGSGSIAVVPGKAVAASRVLSPAVDLDPDAIDLTCAATRAPAGVLDAFTEAIAELPSYLADNGYAPVGLLELRTAIADRYAERGLPTTPDQILVTSGAVAGLAIVARALLSPRDRVIVESPTYPNALEALGHSAIRTVAVPVDSDGHDLDETSRVIAGAGARAAYLIPDFHNPTGALLDDAGRERLAASLSGARTRPIIDETIAEVDLGTGAAPKPFGHFSPEAISLGSAAKSFWGGLRIGWLRVPAALAPPLLDARATLDLGAPILEQLVLTSLLRTHGGMPSDRRADLRAARDATAGAVRERLPDASFVLPRGGLSLWVDLGSVNAGAVTLAAAERGLLIAAGPRFAPAGGFEHHVRVPYVTDPARMTDAVDRLAEAVAQVRERGVAAMTTAPARGFVA
ncbi:PLP-dependent aminotransferase family protein [Nostocoides veronense]|uniref:PLP-dependent aminotransferase family protein n=1 Tax=Nostocoides veronense TaxID=330836 RepID=A0ABN2LC04_9MICO